MPDSLTHAETRRLFQVALGTGVIGAGWQPPSPESLAPFFPAYEIEGLIARGGMGAVYRARQVSLNRIVAIKLLPFDLGVREDFAERFKREAEALARLQHPHIVGVHDFGQADDGHYFMVMEFVEGSDLAARLRAGGPLPPEEAMRIVRQVCEALAFAHERGVVHRDIKPANILLDAAGNVKVSDFGISQFVHEEARGDLTMTGTMLGTPDYTAPEQLVPQGAVDARADIFSVGVMLYELLTGTLPRGVFRPVSELVPSVRGLDVVLARAMQSEPSRRYGNVLEMRAELVKPHGRSKVLWWLLALAAIIAGGMVSWPRDVPKPFSNSLGLTFVSAGTERILFCTTETRVRDFEAFFNSVRGSIPDQPIYVNYDGTLAGWMLKPGSWRAPGFVQTPEHPVVAVSQREAEQFCEWLTQHERTSGRIGAADRYRLPTDAEWSVAAGLKADAHDPANAYPWHGDHPPAPNAGNYASGELHDDPLFAKLPIIADRRDAHRYTAPVGSYTANPFGLHDMGGNVVEWLQTEREGPASIRGGGWLDAAPALLDSGHRFTLARSARSFVIGFRSVLERNP